MMLWPNRHSRFRDQLSSYIDGVLAAAQRVALERHLASCSDCRQRLDELRATLQALRELPQRDIPRSFTLTPKHLEQPSHRPAPRLPLAMPLAAGALAFALALVLVVDLGDLGGDGGGQPSTQQAPAETQMEAPPADRAPAEDRQSAPEPAGGTPARGTGAGAGGPLAPQTPVPALPRTTPVPQTTPTPETPDEGYTPPPDTTVIPAGREAVPPAVTPLPEAGIQEAAPAEEADGGLDPLRAAEIALAAALGLLVASGLILAFARRMR